MKIEVEDLVLCNDGSISCVINVLYNPYLTQNLFALRYLRKKGIQTMFKDNYV